MKRTSRNRRRSLIAAFAASVTLAGADETPEGETVRFCGSAEPASVQISVTETSDERLELSILIPAPDGTLHPIFSSGSCIPGKLSGRSAIDGKPVAWSAELHDGSTRITWEKPVSVTLRNGKILKLAGSYEETPHERRLHRANARFREEDDELNRVFKEVKRGLPENLFQDLRVNQRAWLGYRDYITYDGDNADLVGPGTIAHIWNQVRRTHDRIEFLQAYSRCVESEPDRSGFYSNGTGFRMRFREVDHVTAFFLLESIWTWSPPKEISRSETYQSIWGRARRTSDEVWTAEADECGVLSLTRAPGPSHIKFRLRDRGRIVVETSNTDVDGGRASLIFDGVCYRQRELTPAVEPVRQILALLPADCFSVSTEPPNMEQKAELALTGKTSLNPNGPVHHNQFTVETETADYLEVRVPFGGFALRRFSRRDGSALVVATNSNAGNQGITFWDMSTDGTIRRLRMGDVFPPLVPGDFYSDGNRGERAVGELGTPAEVATYHIAPPESGSAEILVAYPPRVSDVVPDFAARLSWRADGFNLERERSRRAPAVPPHRPSRTGR